MGQMYSRTSICNIVNSIERAKTVRSVEDMFLDDLHNSMEKTAMISARQPSKTYKPSGMNCMRMCFYIISGFPISQEKRTSSSIGIADSGTDRHIRIQQALEDMRNNGYDLDYLDVETYIKSHGLEDRLNVVGKSGMETKLYMPSLNLSFMTDGIIKYRDIYYVFEFKTEVMQKFLKRTSVDPGHLSQGTAYSCAFDIPRVLFLYENRNTCEHKPFVLNVTEDMKEQRIYGFVRNCNKYIESKIVPPLPTDPEILKKCRYCQFKALCASHGAASKVVVIPNTENEVKA